MKVDDLILTKSLGKGSFGEVFLTTKNGSNELYATKRLDRAFSERPENVKRLSNEIMILKQINHPNIVRLIELKKTKTHCYIVTEYCNGGSLSDCLKKYIKLHRRPFPEKIVQYLMKQIVDAIHYLHSNKIIHRDLKLDNILVNFPNNEHKESLDMMNSIVKIIDFGFATRLHSSKANLAYTVLGTPSNMEPQLLSNMETKTRNLEGYDEKADIWSLGTLCYEMLVGHMTFTGKNMEELYKKVKQGTYSLPLNLSKEVVSFINGMLQYDPNKRLSSGELLKHDFLVKNVNQFEHIDMTKIQKNISGHHMNINVKNNQSIWAIFNQDSHQQKINNEHNIKSNNNLNNNKINSMNQPNRQILSNQTNAQHHHHHHQQQVQAVPGPFLPSYNPNQNKIELPYYPQQQEIYPQPGISQIQGQYMISQNGQGSMPQVPNEYYY